jgi:hypothetical protein
MDRAGAALPVVAPFFGPRQSDVFAEAIEQGGTRIHLELMFSAIDP